MVLIFHILVALGSLAYTGYVFLFATKQRLYTAYALVFLTVASGTILLVQNPGSIRQVCITGLVYLACVTVGIIAAHYKLTKAEFKTK